MNETWYAVLAALMLFDRLEQFARWLRRVAPVHVEVWRTGFRLQVGKPPTEC